MLDDPFYAESLPPEEWAEPGQEIQPVRLELVRVCEWKRKPCGVCGKAKTNAIHQKKAIEAGSGHRFGQKNNCLLCGKPHNHPDHLGAPESFNLFASGSWEAYQTAKKRWHVVLAPLLRQSGLPRGLARVMAEGECSFGDNNGRDQGNHRVVVEKALGDVLVEEGYLPNDKWDVYEFGNLTRVEDPNGANRLRLLLIAVAPHPEGAPAQGALL